MRLTVLGSGSSGNATLVKHGSDAVLIDCGFGIRDLVARLGAIGQDLEGIRAAFITHEHSDHVRSLRPLAKRMPDTPVYMTDGTARACARAAGVPDALAVIGSHETVRVGSLSVTAHRVMHDASDPVCYTMEADGTRIGLATDLGILDAETAEALKDCDLLGIETNHDVGMLETGPYPGFLKRRIRSTVGHLANDDAADALERLASDRLKTVIGLHVSRTNNTPSLASSSLQARAHAIGLGVDIVVSPQDSSVSVTLDEHR